jgi:hypothetical protein
MLGERRLSVMVAFVSDRNAFKATNPGYAPNALALQLFTMDAAPAGRSHLRGSGTPGGERPSAPQSEHAAVRTGQPSS